MAWLIAMGAVAHAQEPSTKIEIPIKLLITLSRYQGEKKISSMPYTMAVSVNKNVGKGTLRMGSKIPVLMMAAPVVDGKQMPAAGPIQYQDVGTNLDCFAVLLDEGRFRIDVSVDDTSVVTDDKSGKADQPTFRSFKASNSMVLKDGQTGQFSSAVDKVSGEVTKIDVTLTVVK